ncbi:GntR family transcriptional regulator [Orbus hercynius]|uniref:GntR family transcriptional regulator n=1 Tax=Orbus hercynius TaxID=593135 RepID=A0A495RCG1_9GAMM|nr:PLP-dependent aminotransferase family protein [Orbus hercynius]RKS85105.1 GntR family transcriptional regulator [Orbus hercynius]
MWQKEQLKRFNGTLYKKLIGLVEYYIEQGVLVFGERLPSERQLAEQLDINRSTVVRALDELTERKVLIRKMGSGTFVNPQKWGLQAYPSINWHLPAHFQRRISLYQQKVQQLRQQSLLKSDNICDLANGDLPAALIPKLSLPAMSNQELIYQEKHSEELQLGLPSLKKYIAQYMQQQFDMTVAIDEILITSGIQQALFLITQGLLKPGDAIGIESPSYFYSLPLFQAAGVRIYGIKMDQEGIIVDELKVLQQTHPLKLIFLNPVFQNPTGIVMSSARKAAVFAFCQQAGIGIVEDDAYSALSFNRGVDCSPIKKIDDSNQVLYLGSLSKYLGRSIRVGWMIAPQNIIHRLAEIRQYIDSGLSIVPQLLAEDYLKNHYQYHQRYLREQLQDKRDSVIHWLKQHNPHFDYYIKAQGGMHLYLQTKVKNIKQEDELLNRWLSKGVTVSKGDVFGDSLGFIRLSYGHFIQNLV